MYLCWCWTRELWTRICWVRSCVQRTKMSSGFYYIYIWETHSVTPYPIELLWRWFCKEHIFRIVRRREKLPTPSWITNYQCPPSSQRHLLTFQLLIYKWVFKKEEESYLESGEKMPKDLLKNLWFTFSFVTVSISWESSSYMNLCTSTFVCIWYKYVRSI